MGKMGLVKKMKKSFSKMRIQLLRLINLELALQSLKISNIEDSQGHHAQEAEMP